MAKILVTGGAGFIGSAVANHLTDQGHDVHVLDCFTYAADMSRLNGTTIIVQDIRDKLSIDTDFDYILHLAAETHVDNSIVEPLKFVHTNVLGTANVLEAARKQAHLKMFLYFSTDEVFGPAPKGVNYKEWDRYNSGNPYSASKAGGEELALAYGNTYKLPVVITHTMNAFGPGQHDEKFIPNTVKKIMSGETVVIHSDPTRSISGSRFYIHTRDIAEAVAFVMEHGEPMEKYNIVGERETTNLEVAQQIADLLGKPLDYEMVDFHSSRPGHDLRYALDGSRLKDLGWEPTVTLEQGLKEVIREQN